MATRPGPRPGRVVKDQEPSDLARDTVAVRIAPGHYTIELADRWNYLQPSGGAVLTSALRAAVAELEDDGLRLASTTMVFLTPVQAGTLEAKVITLRRGGSAAQLRIEIHAPKKDGSRGLAAETLATFCRDRPGPDVIAARFPDVPMPDQSRDAADGHPVNPASRFPFYWNFDCRIAVGGSYWQPDFAAGPARYARWFRYKVPQRDAAGRLDRLALPPVLDTMPTSLLEAIGPSGYRFYAPSLDLTMHCLDDTDREWLLIYSYCRRARVGWATAEVEVWDDAKRLVAYGTQAMYLHHLGGEPPVIDASNR